MALSTEDFFLTTFSITVVALHSTAVMTCPSGACVTPGDIVLLCTQSHSSRCLYEAEMRKMISTRIDGFRGMAAGFLFGQLLLVTVGKSSVCKWWRCVRWECSWLLFSASISPLLSLWVWEEATLAF